MDGSPSEEAVAGRSIRSLEAGSNRGFDAQALLAAVACRPAWLVIGVLTLGAAVATITGLSVSYPPWVRYVPLAASLLVFGLPHGAVDHLAPARAAGERPTVRWLLGVGAVYLVLGVGYAALWALAPAASAGLFVALTWLHWGQGDLYLLDALGSTHLDGAGVRLGTLVVRGGLPMLVPVLRFPGRYREVVDAWVALFGGDLGASWLLSVDVRAALGVGFALVTVGTLIAGRRRAADDGWRRDAAEMALLWAFFLLVPPLLAVGIYFCVWHSLRHIARLILVDDGARQAFAEAGTLAALFRTGRDAAPLTAVSIVLLGGVAIAGGVGSGAEVRTLAALYLVFISVLTLPHVAIVTWMDGAENAGLARFAGNK
ncbi:Brp/Blh family beta-carotene 15,15'-dioxygenase [Halobellus ordinarius]|uniref:Brp/Blh family beta-carotene 15,15'-dioxygenase n=1 Tax=Halobellus ordinarius TaxID=3075120 RepID=UPI0028806F5F|nr:Brp/Blh family beta-carotene 15,15'-dioxygenase [Halobellus sp. ZY16]